MFKGFFGVTACLVAMFVGGCVKNKNQDDKANSTNQKPADAVAVSAENQVDTAAPVYFQFDSSSVNESFVSEIKIAAKIIKDKGLKIVLEGYCDERGTVAYNQALGLRRAKAVKSVLVKYGVKPESVSIKSYGETKPVVLGGGDDVWAKNRVVLFVFNPKTQKTERVKSVSSKGIILESSVQVLGENLVA